MQPYYYYYYKFVHYYLIQMIYTWA